MTRAGWLPGLGLAAVGAAAGFGTHALAPTVAITSIVQSALLAGALSWIAILAMALAATLLT